MIRPADNTAGPRRDAVVLGAGSGLGPAGAGPLMSDAIRWGDLLLLSGRAAVDPATGEPRGSDFAAQCRVVLEDVGAVLAAAGSDFEHVLRVECWLADAADFPAWNEFFTATFPQPRPARTTTIGQLPLSGLLVELQVTAGVPQ